MSVFKKLVGYLFEEEEDIIEEGELEPVQLREEEEIKPRVQTQRPQEMKKTQVKDNVRVEEAAQPTPVIEDLPPQEERHFTTIEITPAEEKAPEVERPQRIHAQRAKPVREEPVKKEFEFTPVISPIFGADETKAKHLKKTPSVPQHRSTLTSPSKKNPLGTIISPIYGATELEEFEEEARERIEKVQAAAEPIFTESEPIAFEVDDEDSDVISVPLEDLLASEEANDSEEDLLQFSLFGDDEIVRTEKTESSYTIKE